MKIIRKNKHYPLFFQIGIFPRIYLFNKSRISRRFKFTDKSVFIFNGDDILDYSKLFGLSFGHHHKNNSFRFGFRFLNNSEIERYNI